MAARISTYGTSVKRIREGHSQGDEEKDKTAMNSARGCLARNVQELVGPRRREGTGAEGQAYLDHGGKLSTFCSVAHKK